MSTQEERERGTAALLWLECKQVIRNPRYKSPFFPDLDATTAAQIRGMGSIDKVQEWIAKGE